MPGYTGFGVKKRVRKDDVAIRWVAPTLLNGWTTFASTPPRPVQYAKDPMGFVHLRGLASRAAGSSTLAIFNLPREYRPSKLEIFPGLIITAAGVTTVGRVDVATSGDVTVTTGDGSLLTSLSGITFRAEQ